MAGAATPQETRTHCPYCSLQCGMTLTGSGRGGRDLEVQPWAEFPVNEGALCRKGWTAGGLRGSRDRLTTPLLRDRGTGELRVASWDEALDLVAERLTGLREQHGPDSIGVFGGGGLTNEKAYQLGQLARVAIGTRQIDYNGRWCMSSAASAAGWDEPSWGSTDASVGEGAGVSAGASTADGAAGAAGSGGTAGMGPVWHRWLNRR